jgi:PAS domain-containing protein
LETLLQRRAAGRRRTIAIATLNVALVWCIAGAVLWQSYRDAVSDGKRMAENLSLTTAAFTHQALTASDLMLQSVLDWISEENVASEEEFERILNGRRFHDSMRHRMVALPQAVVAAVFGKDGHLLSSSLSWPPPPTNVAGREAFLAQLDPAAPALSVSPTLEINTRQWVFFLTRKVRSISTQLLGVAVVGVDANFFAKLFRSISIGEDSSISLFRLDGSLLATTLDNPDLLGKRYENALPLRMIREGLSGTAQLVHEPMWWNPADTEGRIVAPRQVEGLPAFIAVTIGDRSFLAQWRPRVYLVIAVALAITAITALVTLQFLRLGARSDSAARLAAERRLLAALIDTPAALCAMVDRQGRVIYCNERFRSILASGREADDILRAPELRGADPILAFAGGGGDQPIEVDLEVIEADKVTRFLHFSVSSQALPDIGRCTILVGHDETLRHQAQSDLRHGARAQPTPERHPHGRTKCAVRDRAGRNRRSRRGTAAPTERRRVPSLCGGEACPYRRPGRPCRLDHLAHARVRPHTGWPTPPL